jgi:hypothetical protein
VANTVAAQLFISGVWTTKPAFIEEEIEVQVGPDVETGTRPNEINLTWDNSDLSMDPSNVLSALSGLIGRNTPARVMVGGTVLGVGEASSWQPDRSINHAVTPARGRSWTAFQAQGVLRRIGRWSNPFRSPIFRQISSYDVTKMLGYWSMEGGSTNLPNSISGGFTGKVTGTATWSAIAGPNGSDKVIQLGSDGAMSGSFIRAATGGWQLSFAGKLGSAIGSGTYVTLMRWRTSTGLTYEWQVNNAAFNVHITRDDGTVAADIAATFGTGVTPTTWTRFRCKVTAAGATITVEPAWYNQGATIFGTTGTFAGTSAGVLTNWDVFPTAATNNTGFGHLMATSDTTLDLTGNYDAYASFNGYSGETAAFRFQRLCTEEGIAKSILGAAASTVAMGPQPSGLFTDLLEECARTDHALIYDDPAAVALIFRTRINRYGQTSKLDLTYGNGQHVAPPLKKVIDDQGIANVFTVTNANGSSSTRRLTTGPLSTQSPPAGVGVYKGDVDVNQFDDTTLDDRAAFELNLATLDRPRYKQITVDLLGNPTLVTAANTVRPGRFDHPGRGGTRRRAVARRFVPPSDRPHHPIDHVQLRARGLVEDGRLRHDQHGQRLRRSVVQPQRARRHDRYVPGRQRHRPAGVLVHLGHGLRPDDRGGAGEGHHGFLRTRGRHPDRDRDQVDERRSAHPHGRRRCAGI